MGFYRGIRQNRPHGRLRRGAAGVALTALLWLCPVGTALGGDGFEPNDSAPEARGPLLSGTSYSAEIARPEDRDFFTFYVTRESSAPVEVRLTNTGGSGVLDLMIADSAETSLQGLSFIAAGSSADASLQLKAGKYLIEVVENPAFNQPGAVSYALSLGGPLGPYAEIAAACRAVAGRETTARRRLDARHGRLQRATARLRLAGAGKAARVARRARRRALREVRRAVKALEAARGESRRWCGIPE